MSKKKKHVYARIACTTVHAGEVKNSKFNFQLNIITTLVFGNQFCPYQELLWLHFFVIVKSFVCWLQLDSSMALCNVEQFINPMCYLYQYFGPQWVIFQDIKLAFGLSS